MTYHVRSLSDPDRYTDHATLDEAWREAIASAHPCDECGRLLAWATRSVLVTGSRIDHQTVYLTVLCPRCLPIVAERIG